ncbi:hypothetical protein ACXYUI_32300, partial [Klebsiella pneumoniae]
MAKDGGTLQVGDDALGTTISNLHADAQHPGGATLSGGGYEADDAASGAGSSIVFEYGAAI